AAGWGMSLPRLWAFVAVALPAIFFEGHLSSVDLAYHVRAGEIMLRTHALIRTDSLAFTSAGRPWLDQQWGAQVLFAAVYRAGGWAGLAVAKAVIVAVVFLTVYLACRAAGGGARLAAGLTLGAYLVAGYDLALRPQLLAMALFGLTL